MTRIISCRVIESSPVRERADYRALLLPGWGEREQVEAVCAIIEPGFVFAALRSPQGLPKIARYLPTTDLPLGLVVDMVA